jgi:hypothetical protein
MIIPLEKLDAIDDEDKRDDEIRAILSVLPGDNPPFLSVLQVYMAESNAAVQVTEMLASGQFPFRWRIKVLRDEWGRVPPPGEEVVRRMPVNRRKRDGDLVTPRMLTKARKDGSYDLKYIRKVPFKIDNKGCITCGYDDAAYFIFNWGYNLKTRTAVTNKPEYSYEPVDMRDPSKGMRKHVRYWRYAEMDKEDYAALPDLTASQNQKRKGN